MIPPILASTAASLAGNLVHNVADVVAKSTASPTETAQATPTASFSSLVDKANAAAAAKAHRNQDLTSKLTSSPEVAAAVNAAGVAGPKMLQIDADGNTSIKLANGSLKPVQLSEAQRGSARELYQLRQPVQTAATTVAQHGAPAPVSISLA